MVHASIPEPRGEYRAEPVPPKAYRLVADIDPTIELKIFDLPQRQWKAAIHHDRQADIPESTFAAFELSTVVRTEF